MKNNKFSSIENIIKVAKKGNMYIFVDDEIVVGDELTKEEMRREKTRAI